MQEQIHGTAALMTPDSEQPLGWQAVAIGEYERTWPIRRADLRKDLSSRIVALTGRRITPEDVYTDGHLAVTSVDDATFRLYHSEDLVLVRPCAYCGTGHFESPKISNGSELGYALSAWQPLHDDCEDYWSEEPPDF
jgi:hypothetical protein